MTITTSTPTAPLPLAAVSAMARLELAFASPESTATRTSAVAPSIVRAVTRYEIASFRTAQLSAWMDSRDLTGAEFDAFEFAQDVMRESRATLAAARMLHLIETADDHGKTKDPLPQRPRGPHPQYAKAGA